MAPPADELRPHMLIFGTRAGHESWPHLVHTLRLQAAPRGGLRVGPKLVGPTSAGHGVGPTLARRWGHKSSAQPGSDRSSSPWTATGKIGVGRSLASDPGRAVLGDGLVSSAGLGRGCLRRFLTPAG